MKFKKIIPELLGLVLLVNTTGCQQVAKQPEPKEIVATANQGFIFGLPLVYTALTRLSWSHESNTFQHIHQFPDHTFRSVVRPNNDTYYSSGFLDLTQDPVILSIPDSKDRYYVVPLYDAWTNVFASFGKRTTGTAAQTYVITGPDYKGEVPANLTQVKSPTNLVWIIGRYQVNSPEDGKNFVTPIQEQLTVQVLKSSADSSKAISVKGYSIDSIPAIVALKAHQTGVVEAAKKLTVDEFFNFLNELLVDNPPFAADSVLVKQLASIGIGAGLKFDLNSFSPEIQQQLQQIPDQAYAQFDKVSLSSVTPKDTTPLGRYGTNYIKRAVVAYRGLGALNPEEAIYQSYTVDNEKQPLNGKNNYVVHFDKGQTPPSRAFWSYTVYDKEGYLSNNELSRYAIGDRNKLIFNKDGSLDIYIGHQNPGKEKEANWLPAPDDAFNISVRIYWPTEDYLKNTDSWQLPALTKL